MSTNLHTTKPFTTIKTTPLPPITTTPKKTTTTPKPIKTRTTKRPTTNHVTYPTPKTATCPPDNQTCIGLQVDIFDVFDLDPAPTTKPYTTPGSMVDVASSLVLSSLNELMNSASGKLAVKQPPQQQQANLNRQVNSKYGSSGSLIYPLSYQEEQRMMQKNMLYNSRNNAMNFNNQYSPYGYGQNIQNGYASLRDKMSNSPKVIDDEYVSSIKDVAQGNLIYSANNNPKLDNLSPKKLWTNSSFLTVNKVLPITTAYTG